MAGIVAFYLLGGWGYHVADSVLESAVFGLLVGEFRNSHGCRDAERWVVLLDLSSLPHKALQLSLSPSPPRHEVALVCRNYYSWG